jgi:hypothetical protein
MDMAQQITGAYGKDEFIMGAWVKADENRITIAFFNSLGTSMGDLSFDHRGVVFSSPYTPGSFKAEYILADFQFCFYRIDKLTPALRKRGLTLQVETSGDREIRTILQKGERIIEIIKNGDTLRYRNLLRGYWYTLRGNFNDQGE